jgi:hypothetical protein
MTWLVCHEDSGSGSCPSPPSLFITFDVAVLPLLVMYLGLLFLRFGLFFALHYGKQEFDTDQVHVCGPVGRSLIASRLLRTV